MIKLVENRKIEKKQTYGIYSNIQIQRFNKKKKIIKGKACLEESKRAMMEQNPKKSKKKQGLELKRKRNRYRWLEDFK